jgi:hypothetical protein
LLDLSDRKKIGGGGGTDDHLRSKVST